MTKYTEKDLEKLGLVKNSDGSYSKPIRATAIKSMVKSFEARYPNGKTVTVEIDQHTEISPLNQSVLVIDGIVAGLNGSKGLMRGHWSVIKKQKDLFCLIINQQLKEGKLRQHAGEVTIEYIGYKSMLMDWDNFCASFKHIGDSLVKEKIIIDDNPKIVTQFIPQQIKCKRSEQKVVIIIKDK